MAALAAAHILLLVIHMNHNAKKHSIAAVVLAGGRSSRMGKNKALLTQHHKNLIDYIIEVLQQAKLTHCYISGNLQGYDNVKDSEDYANTGPLGGMRTMMHYFKGKYSELLFVPVDLPLLTPTCIHKLIQPLHDEYKARCFLNHPLPLFVRESALKNALLRLTNEETAVHDLHRYLLIDIITPTRFDLRALTNVNTQTDWEKIQ